MKMFCLTVFNWWLRALFIGKYLEKIFLLFIVFLSVSIVAESELIPLIRGALIKLSPSQAQSIQNLNITGCGAQCVFFPSSLSEVVFKVKVDKNLKKAFDISFDKLSRTLTLSSAEFLSEKASEEVLRRFLVSHEFHPYLYRHIKPSQRVALKAFKQALREGVLSFLHISPTGTGKSVVLAKALKHTMEVRGQKLFIVTADQIALIEQLESEIREELKSNPVRIVNWNTVRRRSKTKTFARHIGEAQRRSIPTVLIITSQSLKKRFNALSSDVDLRGFYESLFRNLNSVYIDEAHHLGATKTRSTIDKLIMESRARGNKEVLLYGTTATPVHGEVELRALFEREHWSYLNEQREDFFRTHFLERILEQLSRAINRGDITSFDELYILGENSFKKTKQQSQATRQGVEGEQNERDESLNDERIDLFIHTKESTYYELNPKHYNRLAELLYSIFVDNRKGFILASTIAEADRLSMFFDKYFKQVSGMEEMHFEAYHSEMTREERQDVIERSKDTNKRHYIVAVRALDEGVNLPHLSAYVDLNVYRSGLKIVGIPEQES